MTMTVVQTDDNFFEVLGEGGFWMGNVWAARGEWTAQDWDGDTEAGFETMWGAAQFVEMLFGASR